MSDTRRRAAGEVRQVIDATRQASGMVREVIGAKEVTGE
ncbi:hypothetical protein J2751_001549 [Halorubrum alkaliphilum]|uniref:Uncharacterized protein n=1 Tax=Halorubrum alkaliphilum TaxID=261290 RepID=A0A8T4GFM5_9EURY|nr:hypothetical protein [Halorubrum alkaliphilum]